MAPAPWVLCADRETGIPVITIIGDMTVKVLRECFSILPSKPLYKSSSRYLWDLRGVTKFPPAQAIRHLASSVKGNLQPPLRIAVVVGRDAHFGLTRMFEILSEQPGIAKRVFRDYEHGRDWLLGPVPFAEQDPLWYPDVHHVPAD